MPSERPDALTEAERANLAHLEQVGGQTIVEAGGQVVEAGEALREIRDSRLYRETHTTFEDYCRERFCPVPAFALMYVVATGS